MNLDELREKIYESWAKEQKMLDEDKSLGVHVGEQVWRAEHRGRMNAFNDVLDMFPIGGNG